MKRRTAHQLVRLLSDIRHASHCSTLRAAATNRTMASASSEQDANADNADISDDETSEGHDSHDRKPARSGS
jgi:hypothetical protein